MNNKLFNRKVILNLRNSDGVFAYEHFKISFDIKKTIEKEMNTAEIQIYNLGEASRSRFEQDKAKVDLQAGYESNISGIFKGTITDVNHFYADADLITKIIATDGDEEYVKTRFDKGYPKGATSYNILKDIANTLGVPLLVASDLDLTAKYNQSVAFSGLARKALTTVCRKVGAIWSIQNEVLQVVKQGSSIQNTVISINKDTGMINYPTKRKEGIQFKSLLIPSLSPGRKTTLDSTFIKGTFVAQSVGHVGDNRDSDFVTNCEAI